MDVACKFNASAVDFINIGHEFVKVVQYFAGYMVRLAFVVSIFVVPASYYDDAVMH